MSKCPFCDHRNSVGAVQCQKCGAPLETQINAPGESHAPPPEPGSLDAELLDLLQAGKKIEAVKRHREYSGAGLKESKDYVEALAAKYKIAAPAGCSGVVLLAVVVGSAVTVLMFFMA